MEGRIKAIIESRTKKHDQEMIEQIDHILTKLEKTCGPITVHTRIVSTRTMKYLSTFFTFVPAYGAGDEDHDGEYLSYWKIDIKDVN